MFSRLEWMIAGRYLRARRKEGAISVISLISLIGIFLGVGTLIVVMAVMNGFRAKLVDQFLGAQPHITINSYAGTKGIDNFDELVAELKKIPGITRVAPQSGGTVLATAIGTGTSTGVGVRSLRKEDILSLKKISEPEWSIGSLDNYDQGVSLGEAIAKRMGVTIGDKVTLQTAPNRNTPAGRIHTTKTYEVVFIFRSGYYHDDNVFFFLPLQKAQSLFQLRGRVHAIEVELDQPESVMTDGSDATTQQVLATVGANGWVTNWKRQRSSFLTALDVERAAMFVILSLIILVAALNIISGMIMLVKEKGQNIGIMRTFGTTRGAVLRIFLICGMSVGVVGTVLGVLGGLIFVAYIQDINAFLESALGIVLWPTDVRGFSEIPAIMYTSDVVNVVVLALILSALATLYPAWRAARMDPVEALRYE